MLGTIHVRQNSIFIGITVNATKKARKKAQRRRKEGERKTDKITNDYMSSNATLASQIAF